MMAGLTKWLSVGRVKDALKEANERHTWKVTIDYAREQGS